MMNKNPKYSTLEYLKKNGATNTFKLAHVLGIERDRLLKILKNLEELGLIKIVRGKVEFLSYPPSKEKEKQKPKASKEKSEIQTLQEEVEKQKLYIKKLEQRPQKEMTLRDVVERQMALKGPQKSVMKKDGVVNNFHWIVMRARRSKKMSQEQLAELVGVHVSVISNLEKGQLPENNSIFSRIENILKIKILTGSHSEKSGVGRVIVPEISSRDMDDRPIVFEPEVLESLNIQDLKELYLEKNSMSPEDKVSYWKKFRKKVFKMKSLLKRKKNNWKKRKLLQGFQHLAGFF